MMTDIDGVLKDREDPSTLISRLSVSEAESLLEEGVITGGMIPKIQCCLTAIAHGVRKVIIMDGRVSHSILMEILTNQGAGTMMYHDAQE